MEFYSREFSSWHRLEIFGMKLWKFYVSDENIIEDFFIEKRELKIILNPSNFLSYLITI